MLMFEHLYTRQFVVIHRHSDTPPCLARAVASALLVKPPLAGHQEVGKVAERERVPLDRFGAVVLAAMVEDVLVNGRTQRAFHRFC